MYRLICLIVVIFASLGSLAADVVAVSAQDLSAKTARVSIAFDSATSYRVQSLPGGNGIRVVVSQSSSVQAVPSFSQKSKVIENIIAYNDGDHAYIDVRTKGDLRVDHMINSARDQITLAVNYRFGRETKQADMLPATPKKAAVETAAPRLPATPQAPPDSRELALPQPMLQIAEDSLAAKSLTPQKTPGKLPSAPDTDIPDWKTRLRPYMPWLIGGWALISSLAVILFFFRRRKPVFVLEEELPTPAYKVPLPESQALVRMVQKLLEQGWTASEVERELKLSPGEAKSLIDYVRSGEYEQ